MISTQTRRYGKDDGAAGVIVFEQPIGNQIESPEYGTCIVFGPFKRGPEDAIVPIRSKQEFLRMYGDPQNLRWHLFEDGSHLTPDFVDDYFNSAQGAGTLLVCRLGLEGKGRAASRVFKNRAGADVLRITAANMGRWGGASNKIDSTPVVVATARTFTLVAPGIESNEMIGAEASFTNIPGKSYKIIANTAADPASGEVVFTVGAQHNLILDGVSGPAALTGTASYTTRSTITGTISFPLFQNLTGTATVNETVVTGTGTAFLSELQVGQNVYLNGEARVVESITSNTTLTVATAFSVGGTGLTLQRDNLVVTGTATQFTTDLQVGDRLYVTIDGVLQWRLVAEITSATSLVLSSGYTAALGAGTQAQRDNLTVTGTGTQFDQEIAVGDYVIDPSRRGVAVRVVEVTSATSLKLETPFRSNFASAQLAKQSQLGSVELSPARTDGLMVEIGLGRRFPNTHFSLTVYFNGNSVLDVSDCSLDPADQYFVERVVDEANLAYTLGSKDYHAWIRAESLWTSDYTTQVASDVRPTNGSGTILEMTASRIYTVADLEYEFIVGQRVLPNPYEYPRSFFRVQAAQAPKMLQGTVSSSGVVVTGTSTAFLSEVSPGDYLYDPNTKTVRQVRVVSSNTSLLLTTAFPVNMPALTKALVAGYLQVNQAYDLTLQASVGDQFWVSMPQPLAKGYDDDLANIIPYHYTKFADPDLGFVNAALSNKNYGLARMFCPGQSGIEIQKAFVELAEQLPGEFRCEIPSYIQTASAAESFVQNQLGRSDFETIAYPSYGWKSSPFGPGYRYVSLSGTIAGGESAQALANRGYHFVFAGPQAVLPGILRLPFEASPSDEAILNRAGIQPVLKLNGNVVVFGARTPFQSEVYRFTHVRRITSHITRVLIDARAALEVLFLPNQPGVGEQLVLILEEFAREEYRKGVFSQYLPFRQSVDLSTEFEESSRINEEDLASSLIRVLNGALVINFFFTVTGIVERIEIRTGPNQAIARVGQFR